MRRSIFFIYLLYIIIFPKLISGQNTLGLPLVTNYKKTDFHGGSQTWDIKQDNSGRMYFANNEGLISYDGNFWKTYSLPNKTIVRSLYIEETDKIKIYVGGQDEIGYFAPGTNRTLIYTSLKEKIPKQYQTFSDIWNISSFGESIFFRASDRIFELRNNNIQVHLPTGEWLFLGKAGKQLFAQDRNNGLLQFKDNKWLPAGDKDLLTGAFVSGILPIGADSFLITTRNLGCYYLDKGKLAKYNLPALQGNINTLAKINDSECVIGSSNEGCSSVDIKKGIIQKISWLEGLQNNNIACVFVDRKKDIWVGVNNAICHIAYSLPIKYIKPDAADELSGYSTRIFNNKLYIGTSAGVYTSPVGDTGMDISFYKSKLAFIKKSDLGEAWRLDEVNRQLLLADNSGVYTIKNDNILPLSAGPGSWIFVPTTSVYPAQNILVGMYNGLRMLSFKDGQFSDAGQIDGIHDSFRFLAIDNENNVWASHPYRGIYKLQLEPGNKRFTYQLFTDKAGLPSTFGNFVFKIKNRVVFATEKGVYEFDGQSNRFIPSPSLSPVFKDMDLRYLSEDTEGNIWFCSGKKIGVVDFTADKQGRIFYIPELTDKILLGFENVYTFNKKNIFIGSERGIIHFNYERYLSRPTGLNVLLNTVKAIRNDNDIMVFGGYTSGEKTDQDISLAASYKAFHFEYSTPVFGTQNNIEYSYRLEGYDGQWSAWSLKTEKDYTNLPEGNYNFKIKARDNLGNESEITSCSFVIRPPWFKTPAAYAVYLLLICCIVYLLYKWQKYKLRLQQIRFEAEQNRLKYIHQLELEKNEKEIMVLRNEMLANEILLKKKELANASLHLVENSGILKKIKEEVDKLPENNGETEKIASLLKNTEKPNVLWDQFATHFDEINDGFLKRLKEKHPELSNTDLKVCSYLRLNLSSKEIAHLLNISVRGVEVNRYRIRKKLQLRSEQSLSDFIITI